jgi:hypothetical protein
MTNPPTPPADPPTPPADPPTPPADPPTPPADPPTPPTPPTPSTGHEDRLTVIEKTLATLTDMVSHLAPVKPDEKPMKTPWIYRGGRGRQ